MQYSIDVNPNTIEILNINRQFKAVYGIYYLLFRYYNYFHIWSDFLTNKLNIFIGTSSKGYI